MKFSCDRCDAQYMISDEKVGPNGVKVRCKKCGNVILVRRVAENGAIGAEAAAKPAAVAAAPAAAGGGAGGAGLEDELGSAFDHAFGDPPAAAPNPDLDATQALGADDAAKIAAAAAPAPAATEWYVAIGQAQVGPLPLVEVKKKWEGGDVGPDSLVWRPGMGDWAPLSSVADLAGYLAPVPQPSRARAAPAAAAPAAAAPRDVTPTPAAAPAPEVSWKPSGASALAALASEEIAVRSTPEAKPEPKRNVPSGMRSLVEDLPDGGGVDPTGAIPLPMKALEPSEERKIERRSSVARGAEEIRRKRGNTRMVVGVLVALGVVGGGAAGAWVWLNGRPVPAPAQPAPVAVAPAAPAPVAAAPAPVEPPAPPAPAAAQPAPAAPPPVVAAAEPPAKAEPPVAKAEPAPAKAEPPPPPKHAAAAKAPPPAHEKPAPRTQVAKAEPPPAPAAAPAPAAPRKAARDPLLDFDGGGGNDDALNAALGTAPSGRSVYVPGGTAKPAAASGVTDSQVTGAILTKRDALAACVTAQRKSDPEASGTIKMGWSIAPDGTPQNVHCLTPEFASTEFAKCVSGVLRGVRFPASSTGRADVSFPLKF